MEEPTATLRTFSSDKYDAMEANIPYQDKDKRILRKKKVINVDRTYLLTTIVLLSFVIIAFMCNLFTNINNNKNELSSRALYESYNLEDMQEQEYDVNSRETTNRASVEGFHSYNPIISMEQLYNDSIESKNYINNEDKYKVKYYKLIEICVPNLRRRLKN